MTPFARRIRRTPVAVVAAAILSCTALAGCHVRVEAGSDADSGPDLAELEAKLVSLQEEKSPDLDVGEASCPDEVDLTQGSTFECTVEIEGVEAPYSVTLTKDDPEGNSGSFDIKPAKAIIDGSIVADFIRDQVDAGSGVEIECGDERVIIADVGETFDCTISNGQQSQTVTMVVKDLDGTVGVQN